MTEPTFTPEQIVSTTKLLRNFSFFLDKSKEKPLLVLRNNEPEFVLISLQDYTNLIQKK